jgi:hypothetical protein
VGGAGAAPGRTGPDGMAGSGGPVGADGRRYLRIEAVQAGRTVAVTRSVWAPVRTR